MVTGDGTTGHIFMCMSMDIGQDQKPAVHMKQVIGKADLMVNPGSEVAGTEKIIIDLQAMFEFGNRNGREAIKMAVRRSIASEE